MIRGTTPTFKLMLNDETVDLTQAVNIYATTPTTSQQVVTPDANYDYLSQVTVNAIPYTETANTYGITVTIG